MRIVAGHDEVVAQWTREKMGLALHPPYTALGVIDHEGTLRGSLVFHDWNGANIEITIYLPRALQRGIIKAAFQYAFVQVGAIRLTAKVRRDNVPMRKLLPRLGFAFEATLKSYYGPKRENDALLFRLSPAAAIKWM